MTKKQLHMALRTLKQELKYIRTFGDYVSISIKGHEITTAIFDKGISKTDMKFILSWENAKEAKRNEVIHKRVA